MDRLRLSIPMLCLIAVHVLFGGARGASAICFGGHGHDGHAHASVHGAGEEPGAIEAHCSHDHDGLLPVPVPADLVGDCCTCTDVTVHLRDLPASIRDADDASVDEPASSPPAIVAVATPLVSGRSFRGPPPPGFDDPAGRHRLRIVRTTRLLI